MDSDQQQDIESISKIRQELENLEQTKKNIEALRDYSALIIEKEKRNASVKELKEKIRFNKEELKRLANDKVKVNEKLEAYNKMSPVLKLAYYFIHLNDLELVDSIQYDVDLIMKENKQMKKEMKKWNHRYGVVRSNFMDRYLPLGVTFNEYEKYLFSVCGVVKTKTENENSSFETSDKTAKMKRKGSLFNRKIKAT